MAERCPWPRTRHDAQAKVLQHAGPAVASASSTAPCEELLTGGLAHEVATGPESVAQSLRHNALAGPLRWCTEACIAVTHRGCARWALVHEEQARGGA